MHKPSERKEGQKWLNYLLMISPVLLHWDTFRHFLSLDHKTGSHPHILTPCPETVVLCLLRWYLSDALTLTHRLFTLLVCIMLLDCIQNILSFLTTRTVWLLQMILNIWFNIPVDDILTLTVAQPFWWINELWQALLIENVINLSLKHNPTPIGNIILWYCIILFEHLHDETCRDNDWEGYKEGNNACQAIADGHFGYKLFIKGSNITFSSFFSLRYSSFPFFSDDSSRGKRLRCSRAPLPLLRSSSWSSLLPPSYGRAALAFFLRYSVRACGIEYLLVQTRYKIRILGLHPVCGLVQATNELG